jgi:hypothetical protein
MPAPIAPLVSAVRRAFVMPSCSVASAPSMSADVTYASDKSSDPTAGSHTFDALEFIARVREP